MNTSEYKGYKLQPQHNNPRSIEIKNMKVGGSLPVVLSGLYTDRTTAMKAIDAYLQPKVKE